ncbi:MAG: M23 family metallopeptidase [Spirochaetaceae bacterium]|nr:MAG: M23 family metallopeptidase [Spirochaetaceae bacterium]
MSRNPANIFCLIIILLFLSCFSISAQSVHIVQSGDTLFGIAKTYLVSVDEIRELNSLSANDTIYVGQRLQLPVAKAEYVVERGDTLFGLARRFDTTVARLRAMNGLSNSDLLRVGQIISVPGNTSATEVTQADVDTTSADNVFNTGNVVEISLANEGEGVWPHSGKRSVADGKFPGIFIAGEEGDPVVSVSTGRVIYSGPHAAFGHVVFVQSSNGYIYVYGGSATPDVSVGQQVVPGYQIGRLANNPLTQETAVFFSVWKDNQYFAPDKAPRS